MASDAQWLALPRVRELASITSGVHAPLCDLAALAGVATPDEWFDLKQAWAYYQRRGHQFEAPHPPSVDRFRREWRWWVRMAGRPQPRRW